MFVLLFAALKVAGQTTGYLRFDTVRIMKQNGTCELYLINKTKDSLGLLTNVGGGLTQFRRSKMLNDSTIIVGLDTLTIHGTGVTPGITELTGPITAGPGSGSQATSITNNSIEKSKLEQSPGLSIIGNIGNTTDDVGNITAANDGNILRRFGTSIGFGTINLASTNAVGSSILPVLNGGTGTAFPGLVQGTNITITGTWPNQTINSSGGGGNLDATLALGGRLSADRSVSMGHKRWDLDSAAFRLRGVDSVPLSIDLAKSGDIIRINKPEGAARTYPGSTPFKFLMENSTDDIPGERNNPVKWGWNINRADSSNYSGMWWSMEPNYRPGGAKFKELIYEVSLPNGIIKNSRLLMSTFVERDSLGNSDNTWDFRGTNINAYNLENTVGYWSVSRGSMNIHNTIAGSTDFSITNGSDAALFSMSPSTSILDYTGAKLRINGAINLSVKNNTSTERELISFEGDAGTTGYIGKYNSAWASQTHLQNGMVFLAANGTPTETMFLLKPGGTAWIGDLDAYNSGTQKVNISGSLALRGIGKATTAPEILVRTSDSTTRGMDTADFRTMMGIITANSNSITHTLDAEFTTSGNSGTGETDLYTYTIPANKLAADGRTVNFEIDGEVNDATATAQLKLYFAGNTTLNTGAVNITAGSTAWTLKGYIIRTSSSTAHVKWELDCLGLATPKFLGYSNLTSLDFTATNIIKVTAQAGGAGGGTDDITAHSWQVVYKPQPQ